MNGIKVVKLHIYEPDKGGTIAQSTSRIGVFQHVFGQKLDLKIIAVLNDLILNFAELEK